MIPIGKGSTLFPGGGGVCRSNLFEFYNILTIKPRIKSFSLNDPNDFKLTQKKDIDNRNHSGKFGTSLTL